MKKYLKGTFNKINNGDFLKTGKDQTDFPDAWLKIGGNHTTRWDFRDEPLGIPVLEINNSANSRAGIIQTNEASLDVGQDNDWLINIIMKSDRPELEAYLRCYPIMLNGDVSKPLVFRFSPGQKLEKYKQVITPESDSRFMRLEAGILGPGRLYIYQFIAYPILAKLMKKHVKKQVKKANQAIHNISHIESIGEITKPIHLATPIPLQIPVNVRADVNADIRNLTPTRDRVQIFGSSQVPLATSISGRAQVEISGHEYHESIEEVTANQTICSTITRDISALPRLSFAVYNFGTHLAYVQAELSPDGVHWAVEGTRREVGPGKLVIVSPENFLRYTRLSYGAGDSTTLKIWVQAQS